MITVSFRYDDPSPNGDHLLDKGIIDVLSRHAISACFAVIPYRKIETGERIKWTKELAEYLIDAQKFGTIEIAQHGCYHARLNVTKKNSPSEFFGIPLKDQITAIREGLIHLESIFGKNDNRFRATLEYL